MRADRRVTVAVLAAILVAPAAACSAQNGQHSAASKTPVPPSASASHGPTVIDPADGLLLTLPSGWVNIPLGSGTEQTLKRAVHGKATASALAEQVNTAQLHGAKIFAVDPAKTRPGQPTTMSVVLAGADATGLDNIESAAKLTVTRLNAESPSFDRVTLPAGPALRVHYQLSNETITQYYVVVGAQAVVLTITDQGPSTPTTYDAVARSLRIGAA